MMLLMQKMLLNIQVETLWSEPALKLFLTVPAHKTLIKALKP